MNEDLSKQEKQGYLDLTPKMFSELQPQTTNAKFKQHMYELKSMIIHHGYSTSRGHYYSIIKVQQGDHSAWAKFDDDQITFIEESQIDQYS